MGNIITEKVIRIEYGPHMNRNPRAEKAIVFLEDESNDGKPIPPNLLLEDEKIRLKDGRLACATYIREKLQGGVIG